MLSTGSYLAQKIIIRPPFAGLCTVSNKPVDRDYVIVMFLFDSVLLRKNTFCNQIRDNQPEQAFDEEEEKAQPTDALEPCFKPVIHGVAYSDEIVPLLVA
jgi:hypothetical protein